MKIMSPPAAAAAAAMTTTTSKLLVATSLPLLVVVGFLAVVVLPLPQVAAIECYVCDGSDTTNPFQCGEYFERFDMPDIQPHNCSNVHGAKFCVKHVGRFEGGIGAKRFCSSKDLGNYCAYVRNKGDRMDYRSCLYTCDSDGCNAATPIKAVTSSSSLMTVILTALVAAIVATVWQR